MLEEIRTNIGRLIAAYETEKQRSDQLQSSLQQRNAEIEAYKEQITDLKKQIDNLKLTGAFTASGDNRVAKERIDRLIREIDKCIDLIEA